MLGSLRRLVQVLSVALRHGLAHVLSRRFGAWPWLRRRLPVSEIAPPERLRMAFEECGGTFIKFGQMLALQPDLLDREYCNALYQLLDRVEPFPYDDVERIIREELGAAPEDIFDPFERKPLATASVGQVHIGWIDGQKLAVKVQRPNAGIQFRQDTRLMVFTMRLIRGLRLNSLEWLLEPLGEFVDWTEEELDYRNEARYASHLRRLSAGSSSQYIPFVLERFTRQRTLVVEFLEGVPLVTYLRAKEQGDEVLPKRLEARGFDRMKFAANVIDNFLGDAFRHGIYHADLHPANLMILDNSKVGYIDFGITGMMSPYSRNHLSVMTLALAQGDTDTLFKEFLTLSAFDKTSDTQGLLKGLQSLVDVWYEEQASGRRLKVSFTRVMTDMLHLSRQSRVMPEKDIIKYIRSAIAIDGLNSRFEPEFHVGEHLEAVCARTLRWKNLSSAVNFESLLGLSTSSARLMSDGMQRGGQLLGKLSQGEMPLRARIVNSGGSTGGRRGELLQLAALICTLSLLMTLSPTQETLGFNLFTAQVVLFMASLGRLLRVLWLMAA